MVFDPKESIGGIGFRPKHLEVPDLGTAAPDSIAHTPKMFNFDFLRRY